jgi:hypothetical protein
MPPALLPTTTTSSSNSSLPDHLTTNYNSLGLSSSGHSDTARPTTNGSLSQEAIVGIAVGCSVFVVIIIILGRVLCYCRVCQANKSVSYPIFPDNNSELSHAGEVETEDNNYGSQLNLTSNDLQQLRVQYIPDTNRVKHTDVTTNTADQFQY